MRSEKDEFPLDPKVTPSLFTEWRSPRFGNSNPQSMNNPVWEWLIKSKVSAYQANKRLSLDLDSFINLFKPPLHFEEVPAVDENEYGTHRIRIDGTLVRYVEESDGIQLTVEGDLPPSALEVLSSDLQQKLSRMENVPCKLVPITKASHEQ